MMEPTETSRFRVMSTTACAAATIARMAALEMIALRFPGVMNCGRSSVNVSPSRSRKPATPLIRNFRTNRPKPLCASSLGSVAPSVGMRVVAGVSGGGHHHGLLVDGGRVHFRDELAFRDDKNAVGDTKHFRQVGGNDEDGQSFIGGVSDNAVNLRLRADVDPVRWLVEDEHLWPRRPPAG